MKKIKLTKKLTIFLLISLALVFIINLSSPANQPAAQCGSCNSGGKTDENNKYFRGGIGGDMIVPYYYGSSCTQIGGAIKNTLTKTCTYEEAKFFVDNIPVKCENNLTLTLLENESIWIFCQNLNFFKEENKCEGVHNVRITYCGLSFPFKYGALSAYIILPLNKEEFEFGDEIFFNGLGDENINKDVPNYYYEWYSSIDGLLSKEKDFYTNKLSVGTHTITFKVRKNESAANSSFTSSKAQITITIVSNKSQDNNENIQKSEDVVKEVENPALTAEIILPISKKVYYEDEWIKFRAFSFGGTKPYSYEWTSSEKGGTISTEKDFSIKGDTLGEGEHNITLNLRDSLGIKASDEVLLQIKKQALKAVITSPEEFNKYSLGDFISLNYSIRGGRSPYTVKWFLNNKLVPGEKIPVESAGNYKIVLEVTDAQGKKSSDSIIVSVRGASCNENNFCNIGIENSKNCPLDCPSGGSDKYCDSISDGICDPDCVRSLDVDCLCNKNGICEQGYENFGNCKVDCPSGGLDDYCDRQKDGVCDPDCKSPGVNIGDPDCSPYVNYLLLLFLIISILAIFFFYRKKISSSP